MVNTDVVLIGGPPGAGKTTLGRSLATALGFASLTGDDLAIACRMVTTQSTHPALHLMENGAVDYFTHSRPAQLIADAEAVASTIWPAVERVISSHARSGSPTVIDWWLLSPALVSQLGLPNVNSVWLHLDPHALEERERSNTDFFGSAQKPNRMLSNFMERSLWRNNLVAEQAEQHEMPVLHLQGTESPAEVARSALDLLRVVG